MIGIGKGAGRGRSRSRNLAPKVQRSRNWRDTREKTVAGFNEPTAKVATMLRDFQWDWLDEEIGKALETPWTDKPVEKLADAIQNHIIEALDEAYDRVDPVAAAAMDGFWQIDPDIDFRSIALVLMEDYYELKEYLAKQKNRNRREGL